MILRRYETDHNHLPVAERPPIEVGYNFKCPGCLLDDMDMGVHSIRVEGGYPQSPRWSFNNDLVKPTFAPSILVTTTWEGKPKVCHSFVNDGMIQFLGDCTHPLVGQIVPLPEWS